MPSITRLPNPLRSRHSFPASVMYTSRSAENSRNSRGRLDSLATLTNSPTDTAESSRDSSVDRLRKRKMSSSDGSYMKRKTLFQQEINPSWLGAVLVVCFFTSGLIDSVAFNSWNCFVSMQTGNTVFAALGIGGQPRSNHFQQYYKSLMSIGAFCFGTFAFNGLHRYRTGVASPPSSHNRGDFVLSMTIQASLIITAAALVQADLVSNQPFVSGSFSSGATPTHGGVSIASANYLDFVPIALLALQAAGQVCMSRVLNCVELPTIVVSTLYHDFTGDLWCLKSTWSRSESISDFVFKQNRRQQRRLASILALFSGALVGGEMYKSTAGMGGALWMAAGIKIVIAVTFMFWKEAPAEDQPLPTHEVRKS